MRTSLLAGLSLALAAALAVLVSSALDLQIESVALLGAAAGAVLALVPDTSPLARLGGALSPSPPRRRRDGSGTSQRGFLRWAGAEPADPEPTPCPGRVGRRAGGGLAGRCDGGRWVHARHR